MTRYVVLVKPPDDHPGAVRIYGPWRRYDLAANFMNAVRLAVDTVDEDVDGCHGYAYILELQDARPGEAKRFALEGAS